MDPIVSTVALIALGAILLGSGVAGAVVALRDALVDDPLPAQREDPGF